jgi:hypothetical protein
MRALLRRINQTEQRPFTFYIHPWEVDPEQPRLGVGSRFSQFRHYVNLASTERKLERLLGDFSFGPMSEALANREMHTLTALPAR